MSGRKRTAAPEIGPRRAVVRFLAVFAAVFVALQVASLWAEDTSVERWLIDVGTVRAAAAIINAIDPVAAVRGDGPRLVSAGVGLNVLRGCEGTDLYFLWIAAVLAFPAPWPRRLGALAGGLGLAWVLNQARVIALFYAVRDFPRWFALLHGYLAPALVVVLLGLGFAWYVRRLPQA